MREKLGEVGVIFLEKSATSAGNCRFQGVVGAHLITNVEAIISSQLHDLIPSGSCAVTLKLILSTELRGHQTSKLEKRAIHKSTGQNGTFTSLTRR